MVMLENVYLIYKKGKINLIISDGVSSKREDSKKLLQGFFALRVAFTTIFL